MNISENNEEQEKICGIIRPIADMAEYSASHWRDIHQIISESAEMAGYKTRLVSEDESSGVILGNIVKNIYEDPIIVCDVSGKNPNVMFELGMRIAFEKPVIIITDEQTPYSFDISPVKHIIYPQTLRYDKIQLFKKELARAIEATVEAHNTPGHRGYLQQFGPIKIANIKEQEVTLDKLVESVTNLGFALKQIENRISHNSSIDSMKTFDSSSISSSLVKKILKSGSIYYQNSDNNRNVSETVFKFLSNSGKTSSVIHVDDSRVVAGLADGVRVLDIATILTHIKRIDPTSILESYEFWS